MRALERLVGDVRAVDGRLEPCGQWQLELAAGETRIHRQFALLRNVGDKAIARFASRFGLLRMHSSTAVATYPMPYWEEQAHRIGQAREDHIEQAVRWARNPSLPYPVEAQDVLQAAAVFADAMRETDLRAMAAMVTGQPIRDVEALIAEAVAEMPLLTLPIELMSAITESRVMPTPTPKLRTALEIIQAFGEQLARESRLEEWPRSASFGETLANVVAAVPSALGDERLALESTGEWREVAALIAEWTELVDLLRGARNGGLGDTQRGRLTLLLQLRAEWSSPNGGGQPELADLAIPVVRSRLELALALVDAWPPIRTGPTGLYARVLLGLWHDLADEQWPKRCSESGCGELLPAHRKNSLCETHASERQRRRVARRRLGSARPARR